MEFGGIGMGDEGKLVVFKIVVVRDSAFYFGVFFFGFERRIEVG